MRPHVVRFLDEMLRDRASNWRIEEVAIPKGSRLAGQTLRQADLRGGHEVAMLAARDCNGQHAYNPGADFVIADEATLIVLGRLDEVGELRRQWIG